MRLIVRQKSVDIRGKYTSILTPSLKSKSVSEIQLDWVYMKFYTGLHALLEKHSAMIAEGNIPSAIELSFFCGGSTIFLNFSLFLKKRTFGFTSCSIHFCCYLSVQVFFTGGACSFIFKWGGRNLRFACDL